MKNTRHLDQARRDSISAGLRAADREASKAELKAMLADAVRKTAEMQVRKAAKERAMTDRTILVADYEATETAILSGQIAAERVPTMLAQDPAFGRWYRGRIAARATSLCDREGRIEALCAEICQPQTAADLLASILKRLTPAQRLRLGRELLTGPAIADPRSVEPAPIGAGSTLA